MTKNIIKWCLSILFFLTTLTTINWDAIRAKDAVKFNPAGHSEPTKSERFFVFLYSMFGGH